MYFIRRSPIPKIADSVAGGFSLPALEARWLGSGAHSPHVHTIDKNAKTFFNGSVRESARC
ncbi:MAG: hypothetical protein AUG08_03180 [Acidobacteria bacterium 13_1_20CM_2_55_15]|nr:MAG: hypothetical protein AUH28_07255 [Acidobacteria bacterium 13_1_40CM_56_16]OLE89672.1 MAG: hypothetical protein AUG08_03180 [Acidobacteria bacterium 13_1_20CM_2_55_15]